MPLRAFKKRVFWSVGIAAAVKPGRKRAASRAASDLAMCGVASTLKHWWPCMWLHRKLHNWPSCVCGRGANRVGWDANGRTSEASAGEQQKVGGVLGVGNYISAFPFLAGLRSANFGNF